MTLGSELICLNDVIEGFLRSSIEVIEGRDVVSLRHPYWQLDLPAGWVATTPGVPQFLARQITADEARNQSPTSCDLMRLLEGQGCLTFRSDVESYTCSQAKNLFRAIANEWYGEYYRHELWDALRKGSLSRNALIAWLVHNYHISRSAGVTAARCATRSPRRSIRSLFLQSALEEYSHCEDFYLVRHPELTIPDSQLKSYVHLPWSLAFDQEMLRTAETDWLGHVFVSLFQEYTAIFYEGAAQFFKIVEDRYGLHQFFDRWKAHIDFDLKHHHSQSFSKALESQEIVPIDQLTYSLKSAWFAYRYLFGALDQILNESDHTVRSLRLRLPIAGGTVDRGSSGLSSRYSKATDRIHLPPLCSPATLLESLCKEGFVPQVVLEKRANPDAQDIAFIRLDIADSVFRCLSYAEGHEDVIAIGTLAELVFSRLDVAEREHLRGWLQPATSEAMAVSNFLRELACHPTDFCYVLLLAARTAYACASLEDPQWMPLPRNGCSELAAFLDRRSVSGDELDRLATRHFQFSEFLDLWLLGQCRKVPRNFFAGEP